VGLTNFAPMRHWPVSGSWRLTLLLGLSLWCSASSCDSDCSAISKEAVRVTFRNQSDLSNVESVRLRSESETLDMWFNGTDSFSIWNDSIEPGTYSVVVELRQGKQLEKSVNVPECFNIQELWFPFEQERNK